MDRFRPSGQLANNAANSSAGRRRLAKRSNPTVATDDDRLEQPATAVSALHSQVFETPSEVTRHAREDDEPVSGNSNASRLQRAAQAGHHGHCFKTGVNRSSWLHDRFEQDRLGVFLGDLCEIRADLATNASNQGSLCVGLCFHCGLAYHPVECLGGFPGPGYFVYAVVAWYGFSISMELQGEGRPVFFIPLGVCLLGLLDSVFVTFVWLWIVLAVG